MARSAFSDVSPSMMSQPLSMASAPRLAAPRRNSRRDGSGKSLPASLIRSFASTPGTDLRWRAIVLVPFSAADDHGAQALGHQHGQGHMHDEKSHDRSHGGEMDIACGVVAAEKAGQPLELDRLPDRQP